MNKSKKNNIIIIAIAFFCLGVFTNNFFYKLGKQKENQGRFPLFWKVWNLVEEKYPFKEPSDDDKRYGAIQGLLGSYHDDYTVFFPPKMSKQFHEDVGGEFGGAGMEIIQREGYVVVTPLKNSPAEKAGIKAGDIITHIEGESIYNLDMYDIISRIRGEIGSTLNVTIVRLDTKKTLDVSITRDIIKIPVVKTETIDDTFIISLFNFNQNSIEEFKEALEEFKSSGLKYLLFDLRNNPGGYLSESVDMLSYFIEQGFVLVKEDFGDSGKEQIIHRSKGFDLLNGIHYKMGVLINRGSASASEIFAGALQDHKKAIIIGETSFGKGSIQELIDLDDNDTSIKVTVGRWLTPHDHQISHKGITPDVVIDDVNNDDVVIKEAINILKKEIDTSSL